MHIVTLSICEKYILKLSVLYQFFITTFNMLKIRTKYVMANQPNGF